MSRPNLLLFRKMIVSELRWQINLNPSSQLSTDALASLVLFCFFKKSCRISTVSSGGTIIIMKIIFCLPYFTFIISLSTHTHLHTQHHPPCQIPVLSHFCCRYTYFHKLLHTHLLTAVFRHLVSLYLRTKNYFCGILFIWLPFVCVLTARAARFTECSLSRAWRNKAIKESE